MHHTTSTRTHWRTSLAVAAALALCSLGTTSPALAGTYQVRSCGDAPPGGADNAWVFETSNPRAFDRLPAQCPPASSDVPSYAWGNPADSSLTGLAAWTHLMAPAGSWPGRGDFAQYALTAPSGTTISGVRIVRSVGKDDQGYTVYGRADGALLGPSETCSIGAAYFTCDLGGGAYTGAAVDPRVRTRMAYVGLNARKIAWGVECPGYGCGTGGTLHSAWVAIYASTVTINDATPPSAAGLALPGSGWRHGTITASGSGSDATGIRGFRWYVDGSAFGGEIGRPAACDYTQVSPCTNASTDAVTLDTTVLEDGTHSVKLAAVDAGGNETQSGAAVIQVDNTPPAAPTSAHLTGGGSSSAFSAAWTSPTADSGSPITSSAWQACVGETCRSGTGGPDSLSGTLPVGAGVLRIWLVDASGNGGPSRSVSVPFALSESGLAPVRGVSGGGGGAITTASPAPMPDQGPVANSAPAAPHAQTPTPIRSQPDLRLRIRMARLSRTTARVALEGSATQSITARVRIQIEIRDGGRKTKTVTAVMRRGVVRAVVQLPKAWALSARSARVTMTWRRSDGPPVRAVSSVTVV